VVPLTLVGFEAWEHIREARGETALWMRVPGDVLFGLGAGALAYFVLGLVTGHSYVSTNLVEAEANRGYASDHELEQQHAMAD
jgi:hypothetical protein